MSRKYKFHSFEDDTKIGLENQVQTFLNQLDYSKYDIRISSNIAIKNIDTRVYYTSIVVVEDEV